MTDDRLQKLLTQADERFGRLGTQPSGHDGAAFVETVRSRRARQLRHRRCIRVLATLVLVGGFTAWSWSAANWSDNVPDAMASNAENRPGNPELVTTNDGPASTTGSGAHRRLGPDEIKGIQAEIAALEAEAKGARRLIDLYRAAEARSEGLAALKAASAESVLPPDMLAELGIDRAAAITVTSADAQANRFNQPDEAARSYRSVLTHFPSSRWASVARERLAQTQQMN